MELVFIMPDSCVECIQTQKIWQQLCNAHHINLLVMLVSEPVADNIIKELSLAVFPALIAQKQVLAVGHPSFSQAEKIILQLQDTLP